MAADFLESASPVIALFSLGLTRISQHEAVFPEIYLSYNLAWHILVNEQLFSPEFIHTSWYSVRSAPQWTAPELAKSR